MRLPAAIIIVACFACGPCWAEDGFWRFCVGSDFDRHVAFVTEIFDSPADRSALESVLSQFLTGQNRVFENIQCPLPSDRSTADERRETARHFVEKLGLKIISLQ